MAATFSRSLSRSSVSEVTRDTSSKKSSSSARSRKTADFRGVATLIRRSLDDFDAGAGADAGGPGRGHVFQIFQRSNAARSFYAHVRADHLAHQGNVMNGGSMGTETSRRLDELR